MFKADIDIDVVSSAKIENLFPTSIRASNVMNNELKPHPCGFYFQNMPVDAVTGLAAIPYNEAEELGFLKIDFLHNDIFSQISSRAELKALIDVEPNWSLLENEKVVKNLFHVGRHFDLLQTVKPKSILTLADCLALIRPGKRDLLNAYRVSPDKIRSILYSSDENGYSFKKSHAIAYALVIVIQLHLIVKSGSVPVAEQSLLSSFSF